MKKIFLPIYTIFLFLITISFAGNISPNGSYKKTCTDIELKNYILYAKCQTIKGNYINSEIEIRDFDNPALWIINDNGALKRKTKIRGSYNETCTNIGFKDNTLYAKCQTIKGNYINSEIIINNPESIDLWITNIDGVLKKKKLSNNEDHFWNEDGIDRSKWKETYIDKTRNNWDRNCKGMNCWKYDDEVRDNLDMPYGKINNIKMLSNSSNTIPPNGHYIFLYRREPHKNVILLRENDRSGIGKGDIYINNCRKDDGKKTRLRNKNCPSGKPYYAHVRHTQLNSPYDDRVGAFYYHDSWDSSIWCAGELRIEYGKICIINNDSGHFKPNEFCLKYVVESLKKWKVATRSNTHIGSEYNAEALCSTYDHEL